MNVFKKAESTQSRLKAGIYGFEGSGKTFTASLIMIGLHKYAGSDKPIAFFDTETGSDYVQPLFDDAGIELVTVKAHDLKTLSNGMKEAERECFGLLVDSLTHVYKELCSAYVRNKKDGTHFIRLQDWQPIKTAWADYFSVPYVNSNLHIIWCSRAKNIFQDVLDELASAQSNREQFKSVQVGTGARSETESAYEPSVLIEMKKVYLSDGGRYARQATYIKERFNILDGETFDYPKCTNKQALEDNKPFRDLLPHIQRLNLAGEHVGFVEGSSESLFDDRFDENLAAIRRRRTIALEKLESIMVKIYPGTSGKEKQAKLTVIEHVFGTVSWTEIKSKKVEELEYAVAQITRLARNFEVNGVEYEADKIKTVLSEVAESEESKQLAKEDVPQ